MPRVSTARSLEERLWAKVLKTPTCWLWQGATSEGLPIIRAGGRNGRRLSVRRVVWTLQRGPLTAREKVQTTCNVGRCLRNEHLIGGPKGAHLNPALRPWGKRNVRHTHPERTARGERQGNAKLTAHHIREIRRLYAQGGYSFKELGRRFGISDVHVSRIVHRVVWGHVP